MNKWIKNRKPTQEDSHKGLVWRERNNDIDSVYWKDIREGESWQPIIKPSLYVEPTPNQPPKRFVVIQTVGNYWCIMNRLTGGRVGPTVNTCEDAERIATLYDEVCQYP